MPTVQNMLVCVFSYNMGRTLDNCLASIFRLCPDFSVALIDDQSDDPETVMVINRYRPRLLRDFTSADDKAGKCHGNLYSNIQMMCEFASAAGYDYLFMIQDDMQIVRPLDDAILQQYEKIFASDQKVLQVDPRFLRTVGKYDIAHHQSAYCFSEGDYRRSYADVGILRLSTLKALNWQFLESESANKKALTAMGLKRMFPFTPVCMHVPFPHTYRRGRKSRSLFPINRGAYGFHDMTSKERKRMDERPLAELPHFRTFLRPKNMRLSLLPYWLKRDAAVFR